MAPIDYEEVANIVGLPLELRRFLDCRAYPFLTALFLSSARLVALALGGSASNADDSYDGWLSAMFGDDEAAARKWLSDPEVSERVFRGAYAVHLLWEERRSGQNAHEKLRLVRSRFFSSWRAQYLHYARLHSSRIYALPDGNVVDVDSFSEVCSSAPKPWTLSVAIRTDEGGKISSAAIRCPASSYDAVFGTEAPPLVVQLSWSSSGLDMDDSKVVRYELVPSTDALHRVARPFSSSSSIEGRLVLSVRIEAGVVKQAKLIGTGALWARINGLVVTRVLQGFGDRPTFFELDRGSSSVDAPSGRLLPFVVTPTQPIELLANGLERVALPMKVPGSIPRYHPSFSGTLVLCPESGARIKDPKDIFTRASFRPIHIPVLLSHLFRLRSLDIMDVDSTFVPIERAFQGVPPPSMNVQRQIGTYEMQLVTGLHLSSEEQEQRKNVVPVYAAFRFYRVASDGREGKSKLVLEPSPPRAFVAYLRSIAYYGDLDPQHARKNPPGPPRRHIVSELRVFNDPDLGLYAAASPLRSGSADSDEPYALRDYVRTERVSAAPPDVPVPMQISCSACGIEVKSLKSAYIASGGINACSSACKDRIVASS